MRSGSSPSLRPQDGEPTGAGAPVPSTPQATGPSLRGGPARALWTVAAPLVALALAVLFLATSGDITGREGSYPRALAVIVGVLALLSIWGDRADARREAAADPAAEPADADPDGAPQDADSEAESLEGRRGAGVAVRRVLALSGVTVLSVYLMTWLGFFTPALLLVGGGLVVLGVRSPWRVSAYAAGIVLVAYLLFVEALRVPFPPAPWS